MPTPAAPHPLARILLATDLSARSDRALDRAVALARETGAALTVLHVSEPDAAEEIGTEDRLRQAEARLLADLPAAVLADIGTPTGPVTIRTRVADGDPAATIRRIAEDEGFDLIVTGLARSEPLGRLLLGDTVDKLLRRSTVPVLVVRQRATCPYRQMLIATDLSAPARRAAEAALTLLPDVPATVIYAFDVPFQKMSADPAAQISAHGDTAARRLTNDIDALAVPTARLNGLTRIVLPGPADQAVAAELARDHADLVVLGTRGQGVVAEAVLGSMAKRILAMTNQDALVVPRGH
ncbi:universal stress protein [uncultured Tistrella sp.]|uniref:universal stress protein n=1 Tax=Tistrella mobilis TaxID=171437 RepID=UPI000C091A07|nr:universal stress protein [uncultured Tistrella sp.]MAM73384.1 universal stress protein UspA [Tistrella sp.]